MSSNVLDCVLILPDYFLLWPKPQQQQKRFNAIKSKFLNYSMLKQSLSEAKAVWISWNLGLFCALVWSPIAESHMLLYVYYIWKSVSFRVWIFSAIWIVDGKTLLNISRCFYMIWFEIAENMMIINVCSMQRFINMHMKIVHISVSLRLKTHEPTALQLFNRFIWLVCQFSSTLTHSVFSQSEKDGIHTRCMLYGSIHVHRTNAFSIDWLLEGRGEVVESSPIQSIVITNPLKLFLAKNYFHKIARKRFVRKRGKCEIIDNFR